MFTGSSGTRPLLKAECFWRDHQKWLESSGYMLRPRYMPDWVPSWKTNGSKMIFCEDYAIRIHLAVMDATRISDGKLVALKKISKSVHPYEIEIGLFLSSPSLRRDSRNHCVPTYDVLHTPDDDDVAIIVTPLLRPYDDPKFHTIGEIIEFFRQIFEGLQLMHDLQIAHRDIKSDNIMMDASPLYPKGFHPVATKLKPDYISTAKHYTRTQRPTKYHIIDFGISRQYDSAERRHLEYPIRGGDKTVPEFQGDGAYEPSDPFPTDVYYVGNMIREDFLTGTETHPATLHLDFMWPLITDMVQDDPTKRPTMDEVVARFDEIYYSLDKSTLRSRAILDNEGPIGRCLGSLSHGLRRTIFVLWGTPPIPTPAA